MSGDRGATAPAARHGLGRPAILLAAGAAATGVAATGYALQRSRAARYRVDGEGLIAAGLSLPDDVEHHFTTVSDGGRIHAVERGRGPTVVLVHGITLGVAVWAHQLRHLAPGHRVIAIGQRGHGQSLAGTQGYSLERMAEDLAELLESLEVRDATVVGHSLGGMVAQLLALHHSDVIARRVSSLVLVATSATGAPAVPGALRAAGTALATRSLSISAAKGKGIYLQEDLATWLTRLSFGAKPQPADVELTRSMIDAMSPSALAEMLGPLVAFDVRAELGRILVPTQVVVGTRDVLTPPRRARILADGLADARLTQLAGCGHMVMLERPNELADAIGAVRAR